MATEPRNPRVYDTQPPTEQRGDMTEFEKKFDAAFDLWYTALTQSRSAEGAEAAVHQQAEEAYNKAEKAVQAVVEARAREVGGKVFDEIRPMFMVTKDERYKMISFLLERVFKGMLDDLKRE